MLGKSSRVFLRDVGGEDLDLLLDLVLELERDRARSIAREEGELCVR